MLDSHPPVDWNNSFATDFVPPFGVSLFAEATFDCPGPASVRQVYAVHSMKVAAYQAPLTGLGDVRTAVSLVGCMGELECHGSSGIVDPDGNVLQEAALMEEALVVAEIDIAPRAIRLG